MATQISTFSEWPARWLYTKPAFGRTGRSLSENNFAKERRNWIAILLREVFQNALDARINAGPVTVKISEKILTNSDANFVDTLIPSAHLDRFKRSVPHIHDVPVAIRKFLVIEDFGTSGLTGETENPASDEAGQNWNAFWFREGEGGKEHGAGNGGAGQGKITYFSTSEIRTIFAYTVRSDDGRQALYGASSFLRDYSFDEEKWLRDSYWGLSKKIKGSEIAIPAEDQKIIETFREVLGVSRKEQETGLSLIIPSPREFILNDAIEVTIAEFFTPILRGDLIVVLGDLTLNSESIISAADERLPDEKARSLHTCTTKGYRNFIQEAIRRSKENDLVVLPPVDYSSKLSEASFSVDSLSKLREDLANGIQIGLRLAVVVKPKEGANVTCHFDVHLMCPEELSQTEQAIVRKDLLIGEEPFGGASLRQRARGLTLIQDNELSKLLLSAEEATHLRWNTRLPRLKEYYKSGPDVVSFVRNAMAKILDIVNGVEQQRDFKILARFFPAPGTASQTKARGKKSAKGKEQSFNNEIPPPVQKKLVLQALSDGCKVAPNLSYPPLSSDLPMSVKIEFAYEGLDKDAFAEYNPLDFDLSEKGFTFSETGCSEVSKSLNVIEFQVVDQKFEFQISGFDKNLRLRARLNYMEVSDAASIDIE